MRRAAAASSAYRTGRAMGIVSDERCPSLGFAGARPLSELQHSESLGQAWHDNALPATSAATPGQIDFGSTACSSEVSAQSSEVSGCGCASGRRRQRKGGSRLEDCRCATT